MTFKDLLYCFNDKEIYNKTFEKLLDDYYANRDVLMLEIDDYYNKKTL